MVYFHRAISSIIILTLLCVNGCATSLYWQVKDYKIGDKNTAKISQIYLATEEKEGKAGKCDKIIFNYRVNPEEQKRVPLFSFPKYNEGYFTLNSSCEGKRIKHILNSPFSKNISGIHVIFIHYPTYGRHFGNSWIFPPSRYPIYRSEKHFGDECIIVISLDLPPISDDEIQFLTEDEGNYLSTMTPPKSSLHFMRMTRFGKNNYLIWRYIQDKCAHTFGSETIVNYDTVYPIGWIDKKGNISSSYPKSYRSEGEKKLIKEYSGIVMGLKQKIGDIKYIILKTNSFNYESIQYHFKKNKLPDRIIKYLPSNVLTENSLYYKYHYSVNSYYIPFMKYYDTSSSDKIINISESDIYLDFYNLENTYKSPFLGRIIGTPFTLAIDIATLPVQLLFTYIFYNMAL